MNCNITSVVKKIIYRYIFAQYRILIGGCWYLMMGEVPILKHETANSEDANDRNGGVPPPTAQQSLLNVNQGSPNYHTYVSELGEIYKFYMI